MLMEKEKIDALKEQLSVNQFLLPIGYKDSEGGIHRVVTLKPMTGRTEERILDPKLRENPIKMIEELLLDVIVSIDGIDKVTRDVVRGLAFKDMEYLLVANYITSFDDVATITSEHSACKGKNEVDINLHDLKVDYITGETPRVLKLTLPRGYVDREGKVHRDVEMELPNVFVQQQVMKQARTGNLSSSITKMLLLLVKKVGDITSLSPDLFKDMTKKDRDFLVNSLEQFEGGVDLNYEIVCSTCGETYSSQIQLIDLLGEN